MRIPYSIEQGIILVKLGIMAREQGIYRLEFKTEIFGDTECRCGRKTALPLPGALPSRAKMAYANFGQSEE